jgi:hypothetical protein
VSQSRPSEKSVGWSFFSPAHLFLALATIGGHRAAAAGGSDGREEGGSPRQRRQWLKRRRRQEARGMAVSYCCCTIVVVVVVVVVLAVGVEVAEEEMCSGCSVFDFVFSALRTWDSMRKKRAKKVHHL